MPDHPKLMRPSAASHRAYLVARGASSESSLQNWTEIGIVETHRDGKGCEFYLAQALPAGAKIVLRPAGSDVGREQFHDFMRA